MTEQGLKRLLYHFNASQKLVEEMRDCPELFQDVSALSRYGRQSCQLKFLSGAMKILSKQELYVVETRIMDHNTWAETTTMYEKQYGPVNARSERTLKGVQDRALKKMTAFINRMPTGNCFDDENYWKTEKYPV